MSDWETKRILIWGKTYPELSATYTETVCTAGVLESGVPVRLYPFPLRYMDADKKFRLYDWVEVPVSKSTSDTRAESYKVKYNDLKVVGRVPPDGDGWNARARITFADSSWRYDSVEALIAASKQQRRSLAYITPGEVLEVQLEEKTKEDRAEFDRKLTSLKEKASQEDLFADARDVKDLRFRPYKIYLKWKCPGVCGICAKTYHRMQVLDWGLFQLAQKTTWQKATDRLAAIADQSKHEFQLFLGNTKAHQNNFLVVGLWYPKLQDQLTLL
jgi:hypothetical protein